ncbi:hypothetical protein [Aquimarina rhabdastrellae]
MKKTLVVIIIILNFISCSDDNHIETDLVCDNLNNKRLEFTSSYPDENPFSRYVYSYDINGNLISKYLLDRDYPYPKGTDFEYDENNQLIIEDEGWSDRTRFGGEIKEYKYNVNGELIEYKYSKYRTNGGYINENTPDVDTILLRKISYTYEDNLIICNSDLDGNKMIIGLNDNDNIETLSLFNNDSRGNISFEYDSNNNAISGIGTITNNSITENIDIRISYHCTIKHPIIKIFPYKAILTNISTSLDSYIEKIVDNSTNYPSVIEWYSTVDGSATINYAYDFDIEGYPNRIETMYSLRSSNNKRKYYKWEN